MFLFSSSIQASPCEDEISSVISSYYDSFEKKDLLQLGKIVDSELLVLEGTYINKGWLDFRDHHIALEMKEWDSYRALDRKTVKCETFDSMSYAVTTFNYEIRAKNKKYNKEAVDTFILIKKHDKWLISHVHTSSKQK